MSLIGAACAGFLIAVLWMDLIFDSQVLVHGAFRQWSGDLPEPVLASIAAYYRRATTTSRPMSYLIAVVMAILLGALGFRVVTGYEPWKTIVAAVLAGAPVLTAMLRTVPNAVRLGARDGDPAEQSRLARAVCLDHLFCLATMSGFLILWVAG